MGTMAEIFKATAEREAQEGHRIEEYKRIRIVYIDKTKPNGLPDLLVKCYRGKQSKPYAYYTFGSSAERRDKFVADEKASEDAHERYVAERDEKRDKDLAVMLETMVIGTILCNSWGYDQTNIDFYEVVGRTEKSAIIRPIGSEMDENTGGSPMSGRVKPMPGQFTGEPMTKMITAYGVSMKHGGSASPTHPDTWHYCSWYA